MTSSTTGKIDKELYAKIQRLYPNESFEEFLEWALFELKHARIMSKKMGIKLKEYKEASYYHSYINYMSGRTFKTFKQYAKENKLKLAEGMDGLAEEELEYGGYGGTWE